MLTTKQTILLVLSGFLPGLLLGILLGQSEDRPARDPDEDLPARLAVALACKHGLRIVPELPDRAGAWTGFYLTTTPRDLGGLAQLSRAPESLPAWSGVVHVLPATSDRLAGVASPPSVPAHWAGHYRATRGGTLFGDPALVEILGHDLDR